MARSLSADAVLPLAISALAVLGTLRWLYASWRFGDALASKVATLEAACRTRFMRNMVQMRVISELSPRFRKKVQQFLNKYKHGLDMDEMTMCWTAVHNQKIVGVVFVKQMLWTLQDHLQNLPQVSVEMQDGGGEADEYFASARRHQGQEHDRSASQPGPLFQPHQYAKWKFKVMFYSTFLYCQY